MIRSVVYCIAVEFMNVQMEFCMNCIFVHDQRIGNNEVSGNHVRIVEGIGMILFSEMWETVAEVAGSAKMLAF